MILYACDMMKRKGYTFCKYTEQLILLILILLMIDTDVDGVDGMMVVHHISKRATSSEWHTNAPSCLMCLYTVQCCSAVF